jgi:hypothetical protein
MVALYDTEVILSRMALAVILSRMALAVILSRMALAVILSRMPLADILSRGQRRKDRFHYRDLTSSPS